MPAAYLPAVVAGVALALLVPLRFGVRVPWLALAVLAGTLAVLGYLGALVPGDVVRLVVGTGLLGPLVATLGWVWLGVAAAARGGPVRPDAVPTGVWAAVCGALLGELGAAALFASVAPDRAAGTRLVVAASGGALVGRLGHPALLLGGPVLPGAIVAVAAILLARVRQGDVPPSGDPVVLPVTLLAALGVLLPHDLAPVVIPVLAAGALTVLPGARRRVVSPAVLVWTACAVVLAVLAAGSGLVELAATGIGHAESRSSFVGNPLVGVAVGALAAALLDGPAATVVAVALVDRGQGTVDALAPALFWGIALGSLGPLWVARPSLDRRAYLAAWVALLLIGAVLGGLA